MITGSSVGSMTIQYSTVCRNTEQFGQVIYFRVVTTHLRVVTTCLQNKHEHTPQSNIQTVLANNTLSVSNARESFSNNQLAQITQIVLQSILSFLERQHATTTATCVYEQTTNQSTPFERQEQLGQFPVLSSSSSSRLHPMDLLPQSSKQLGHSSQRFQTNMFVTSKVLSFLSLLVPIIPMWVSQFPLRESH
ncbi:Hypothetical predicted protein [Paramuricea clavata]|uniref:Uncharacterized protein n=1 Tax=Paramuricea clavata TaxID=317549 RepID=A0A7D9HG48_PARCT|nr:Hypothetical predicted protein [Paramuricea clavata]